MMDIKNTLSHLAGPIIGAAVVLVVKRARGLSWRDLGMQWPTGREALLWLALFVVLVVAEEFMSRAFGISKVEPWGAKYTKLVLATRVLAMVVLAPASEELVFRGLIFKVISDTMAGPWGAIVITAVLFALLHMQYHFPVMTLVLLDGLFFGFVRYATGSTPLTMLLHGLGNLYAAYQRVYE
jgi:membrane protease YdiL (CAAX protease family)